MTKTLCFALFGLAIVILPLRAAFSAEDDLSGFTLRQLDTAITKSGLASQKIYSILTFDSDERHGADIAILSGSSSGWRVTVLQRVSGGLEVQWRSGKLPYDLAVSSSNNLNIEDMDDGEQVVEFSGCAAHLCGGLDGVIGVLLYSPRSKQVFFAHYHYDESKPLGTFGSLNFSKNTSMPGYKKYKTALQKAVSEILDQ
jgi:hypothetical protein